ncbi:hypothetical protein IQ251_18255 [Saccharopolyspora sp. HNM0983]|uniref:Uncharacterized protein n=1 Tax=Saccharopolyspora montiporae TaxID=2781240 RepID=A0A929BF25_9PSEU|nr:hypothetical protein [Saccharopolyspora sp. HNM0983]MBE9376398.1 hypothetical protein [Saccharopolyspora sp. HNM0983]
MSGTNADLDELEAIASKLRGGSSQLEEAAAAPPAPDVGVATQAVAGALAMLTSNTAAISEALTVIGDAITSSRDLYQESDQISAEDLHDSGPR